MSSWFLQHRQEGVCASHYDETMSGAEANGRKRLGAGYWPFFTLDNV